MLLAVALARPQPARLDLAILRPANDVLDWGRGGCPSRIVEKTRLLRLFRKPIGHNIVADPGIVFSGMPRLPPGGPILMGETDEF